MTAIELSNLASGLLGAIFGALGSFLASLILSRLSHRRRCKGAGRAVLAELCGNYEALQSIEHVKPGGYREEMWKEHKPLVAYLLKPKDLEVVTEAYTSARQLLAPYELLDKYYLIAEMRGPLQSVGPDQLSMDPQGVINKIQQDSEGVRERIEKAINVLGHRVYGRLASKHGSTRVTAQDPR